MSKIDTVVERCRGRLREAAALLLWHYDAIRVAHGEPFQLASGKPSPIYVNCRRVISEPSFLHLVQAAASVAAEDVGWRVDAIAGGETAGIPFAASLATAQGKPLVYVRKRAKGHGLATRVEGHLEPGSKVLLVEDLITDGGSKLGFLDALAEAGAEVEHALVVFDRQQGGGEVLAARGVRLHSVTDRATALAVGEAAGLLTSAARRSVDAYFRDPDAWHRELGLEVLE